MKSSELTEVRKARWAAAERANSLLGPAEYHATLPEEGKLRLERGRGCETPSGAATAASSSDAVPGWEVWRLPDRGDRYVIELRTEYFEGLAPRSTPSADGQVE